MILDRFKSNKIFDWVMNKRGEIFIVAFAVIVIIFTSAGVLYSLVKSNNNVLYVGDKSSHIFVDYFQCKDKANGISENNIVVFKSKEEANQQGYNEFNCSNLTIINGTYCNK